MLSILIIFGVISLFWLLLWKFVLAPNPLIRDFFDLDKKKDIKYNNYIPSIKKRSSIRVQSRYSDN